MKRDAWVLFAIVGVVSALLAARGLGRRAPIPDLFSDGHTLGEAREISARTGRPVFALATADWCGPCQTLKRGALSDPEVVAFLRANTVPVYLEEGADIADIRSLGVRAYPTSVLIEGDELVGVIEGGAGARQYLATIRRSLGVGG